MLLLGILALSPQLFDGLKVGVKRSKHSLTWHCEKCGVVVCAGCAMEKKETVKESLMAHGRHDD
jgi:ribosomal protein L37AE/L43A